MANSEQLNPRELLVPGLLLVGILVFIIVLGRFPIHRRQALLNRQASDIKFKLPGSKDTSLSRFRGKIVLINFWASWCTPCLEEMPSLRLLEEKFAARNLIVLAFHLDEADVRTRQEFLSYKTFPRNLIFDFDKGGLSSYDIRAIPVSYLIDAGGVLRKAYMGPRNWSSPQILEEIETFFR